MSSNAGRGAKNLHERAAAWPLDRRLRKFTEECGEAIAAINRYQENPCRETLLKLAEELEGVRITTENLRPELGEWQIVVRASQLQRFRNALERDGL